MQQKIAIIGISALFPGSENKQQFWQNLLDERDLTAYSNERDFGSDPDYFYDPEKGKIDHCFSTKGGYIRDFQFDPTGYELPADWLAQQDDLYQWSLYVAKEALRDSGYLNRKEILKKCGVVLGNLSFPTRSSHRLLAPFYTETVNKAVREVLNDPDFTLPIHSDQPDNQVITGNPARIVAEGLGLGQTHYALDAACATSLYAIKLASDELRTGKADLMLAGAISCSDQLFIHMGFSIFHAYAAHGDAFAPLDKNSGGLISSEGAGMVVLKRLADAERDGDNILAVIGGVGLSNDGRGKFLLSPNPKGQNLAFERAYQANQLDPKRTEYLECHATGTPLGDKTEVNSIADFFHPYGQKPLLGSVKSNMGHLLTAAGMTGLLKVILAMEHKVIPPNLNIKNPLSSQTGYINGAEMITEKTPWTSAQKQAGINSFGFGGTNAHMVVQEHTTSQPQPKFTPIKSEPLAIIGMDVHFGNCDNLTDFYNLIYHGKNEFRELPAHRWKGYDADADLLRRYGFTDGKPPRGAYIEDFDIDLLRFKIQPKEAETLEPQQALILKVAEKALQDAGISNEGGQNVAVLIAMESELAIHHYLARWDMGWQLDKALADSGLELSEEQKEELKKTTKNLMYYREGSQSPSQHTSFVGNIMASRISALWDFNGPSFTVSCDEQSAFKALEVAQNLLSLGEVDAVVVGGVDFAGGLENVLLRRAKGDTRTFGEGAGAVVLKREKDAREDRIYAVVDDVTNADRFAKFSKFSKSKNADYAEVVSDVVEERFTKSERFSKSGAFSKSVQVGSIAENIGHTGAASGIASLIKAALCLHHRFVPARSTRFQPVEHDAHRLKTCAPAKPWILNKNQEKRRAIIKDSADNLVLMSEAASLKNEIAGVDKTSPIEGAFAQKNFPHLFILRGNGLEDLQQQLADLVETLYITSLRRAAQKLAQQQTQNTAYQLVIIAKNKKDLTRQIAYFEKQLPIAFQKQQTLQTPTGSYFTPNPLAKKGKIALVYPGSSTAYAGLGRDLFQLFPQLHSYFESKTEHFDNFIWEDYLYPDNPQNAPNIYENAIAMMSTGVFFSSAHTEILQNYLGVKPSLAFGYSMGECSSMWYGQGVWNAAEATHFQESPLFKNHLTGQLKTLAQHWNISPAEAKKRWVSQILFADLEQIKAQVERYEHVYLTFINTKKEVIISGDRTDCQRIIDDLQCQSMEVPFQNVIHHDFCTIERAGLLKMHNFELQRQPTIDFYSSISHQKISFSSAAIAENSTQVCCETVDFPAQVAHLYNEGARIFIEVGAGSTCTNWINTILGNQGSDTSEVSDPSSASFLAVAMDQKGKTDAQSIAELLAKLISHGVAVDLSFLYPQEKELKKKRHLYQTIKLGGARVFDTLLNEDFKAKFVTIKRREFVVAEGFDSYSTAEPVFLEAGRQDYFIKNTKTETKKLGGISKIPPSSPTANSKNMTDIITPIQQDKKLRGNGKLPRNEDERIGENGLRLQDFERGEQLEGKEIIFSEADLQEFANGSIAKVFGEEYAIIDTYSRRTMLPMDPYLLVSRVTGLQGKRGEFKPSTMQTEYDIPYGAWYTTDGQIPWAVSVESGQCDLLLISYLGIDFQAKGNLVYRLLDCTLTFVDDLPFEGQTLRYDISINSFVRNGDNLLFFFSYRCYVQDRLVLKMDNGCAGYFKDDELAGGKGVVYTVDELAKKKAAPKTKFVPLLQTKKRSFSKADLRHLIDGNPHLCFDDISYFPNGRNPSLCLPPEQILMLDRIVSVDLEGGAYGLGEVIAEKDLLPDDWYFPCHFRDDEVLAGSLQAEGGGNLLRFLMLMLGLQRLTKDARYQPIFDLPQKVRCRKQVTPNVDTKLVYRLEVKEIGLTPNPYVIADLEIISDDVITVHFENLGLQLREKDNPRYLEVENDKIGGISKIPPISNVLLDETAVKEFALGSMEKAFGEDFNIYQGRSSSRQPNGDLQVITRVLSIDGERGNFKKPSTIIAEYDVPQDAWYYEQNAAPTMPYSVLMEIALQPCGLLGAYLGSTLQFPEKDLFFRNLDGTGEMFDLPQGTDFRGKTLTNKCVLVSSVALGGTVLQNYTFEVSLDGQVFYKGKSSFGFFPKDALREQIGLDGGKMVAPWYEQQQLQTKDYMQIKLDSLYGKMKLYKAPADKPHYRLASDQLNLLDKLKVIKNGGEFKQGYIHATRKIYSYEWFFTNHFYTDPVMPGSLGVEAILQAMQVFALQQDLGKNLTNPRFEQLDNHKTVWKYRGQILQHVEEMQLEIHIKNIEETNSEMRIVGDASLWNDEVRIYEVKDLGLRLIGA